ncbi:hypothetical protein [Mycobacteroides abscessus]|uniref:hypothetical protein n=1 Tax=Mycobacteroides abscessus TaxID=36809 RepID=UPI000C268307|nr:hypothetical protein [Mycobacteroides abscessus]
MRRTPYLATLTENGTQIEHADAYAHNSAVRKSEALVRKHARTRGITLTGDKPTRDGTVYTRRWHASTCEVIVTVRPKSPVPEETP